MHWRVKLAAERVLDLLPEKLAFRCHTALQKRMGTLARLHSTADGEITNRSNWIGYLRRKTDINFDGCNFLEIGTGWVGADVVLYHVIGAKEIWTCDIADHLQLDAVKEIISAVGRNIDHVAKQSGVDRSLVSSRYERLSKCGSLQEIFETANINYLAPEKLFRSDLPESHFDVFYSYSVLQRIPPDELRATIQVARAALKVSGFSYHCIHHIDHNARHDNRLNYLAYLQHSDAVYDLLQSKKFNYQNRLRHSEFLEMFSSCGLETVAEETTLADRKVLDGLRLAKRFQDIPVDDLIITRTQLISRPV